MTLGKYVVTAAATVAAGTPATLTLGEPGTGGAAGHGSAATASGPLWPVTDLNAVEGVWATMKNGLGNLSANNTDQLTAIIKNQLKTIQYRPALIDAFLAQTGLTHEPQPP